MSVNAERLPATEEEKDMMPNDAQPGRFLPPRRKQPALAGVLAMMPGLGQVYVGYYRRGFIHLAVVAGVITLLSSHEKGGLAPFFALFLAFFWLYNVIDAVRLANLYNDAVMGLGPEDLRRELVLTAGRQGSIGGGAFLLGLGVLLLAHTLFDVPLDWLRDWWPVIPIGFGAYLLYRGIKDRGMPRTGGDAQ
jgi:hypothetical protein